MVIIKSAVGCCHDAVSPVFMYCTKFANLPNYLQQEVTKLAVEVRMLAKKYDTSQVKVLFIKIPKRKTKYNHLNVGEAMA